MLTMPRLLLILAAAAMLAGGGIGLIIATPSGALSAPAPSSALSRIEVAQVAEPASSLPGGASSINETYRDWRVACVQHGPAKRCAMSQTQARADGQRLLMVELNAGGENTVIGVLVLPFGLALDAGATPQIDENAPGASLRFSTCVPAGCLVPLSVDAATVTDLRAGAALKIKTLAADGGQEAVFSISLQGFATALDRVAALSR